MSSKRSKRAATAGLLLAPIIIGTISHGVDSLADTIEPTAVKLTTSDKMKSLENLAKTRNGEVFLPAKEFATAIKADYKWNNENKSIVLTRDGITVEFWVNSNVAKVNDSVIALGTAPYIDSDSTMIPATTFIGVFEAKNNQNLKNKEAATSLNTKQNVVKDVSMKDVNLKKQNINKEVAVENTKEPKKYVVQKGDTLWDIAHNQGLSIEELKEINQLKSENLSIGQVLFTEKIEQSSTTHKVSPGDTLWEISKKYDVSIESIQSLNDMNGDTIYIGQVLMLKEQAPIEVKVSTENTYTAGKEDTLSSISTKYGVSADELMKTNNLTSEILYEGQVLKIDSSVKAVEVVQNKGYHEVEKTDTLEKIGAKYGVAVDQLKKTNNITEDDLYEGRILAINKEKVSKTTPSLAGFGANLDKINQLYTESLKKITSTNVEVKEDSKQEMKVIDNLDWSNEGSKFIPVGKEFSVNVTNSDISFKAQRTSNGTGLTGKMLNDVSDDINANEIHPIVVEVDGNRFSANMVLVDGKIEIGF